MNKQKITLILLAIFIVLGGYALRYSFSRSQKIAHNISCEQSTVLCAHEIVPPTLWEIITGKTCGGLLCGNPSPNIMGCDQSATTTPCSQITDIQKTPPNPIQQAQEPMPSFVFGSLSHTYTDKKYGFSFQYPDEITLVTQLGGCPDFIDHPYAKSPLLVIKTPSCSTDSKMTSFEDYQKDYGISWIEDTKLAFHLLSSEPVKTKSGIEGIYQKFSIENSGEQISKRYIFKLPQEGFVIFSKMFDDPKSTYYLSLEQAITESLTFQ